MIVSLGALVLGTATGYFYGLSLAQQGKALSFSYLTPIIRIASTALFALILLHWGTIPFILFIASLIITIWIVILTHKG